MPLYVLIFRASLHFPPPSTLITPKPGLSMCWGRSFWDVGLLVLKLGQPGQIGMDGYPRSYKMEESCPTHIRPD